MPGSVAVAPGAGTRVVSDSAARADGGAATAVTVAGQWPARVDFVSGMAGPDPQSGLLLWRGADDGGQDCYRDIWRCVDFPQCSATRASSLPGLGLNLSVLAADGALRSNRSADIMAVYNVFRARQGAAAVEGSGWTVAAVSAAPVNAGRDGLAGAAMVRFSGPERCFHGADNNGEAARDPYLKGTALMLVRAWPDHILLSMGRWLPQGTPLLRSPTGNGPLLASAIDGQDLWVAFAVQVPGAAPQTGTGTVMAIHLLHYQLLPRDWADPLQFVDDQTYHLDVEGSASGAEAWVDHLRLSMVEGQRVASWTQASSTEESIPMCLEARVAAADVYSATLGSGLPAERVHLASALLDGARVAHPGGAVELFWTRYGAATDAACLNDDVVVWARGPLSLAEVRASSVTDTVFGAWEMATLGHRTHVALTDARGGLAVVAPQTEAQPGLLLTVDMPDGNVRFHAESSPALGEDATGVMVAGIAERSEPGREPMPVVAVYRQGCATASP
jgi:hypothetical protein